MARYFKFKSAEELQAEARRLETPITLIDDFSSLGQPIHVGGRRVGNRMAIQPMEGCDATLDGEPDELTYRRFERFGAGGAKLIWGEAAAVTMEGQANPRQLCVTPANAPKLAKLVELCRAAHRAHVGDDSDLLIGLQLTHSGRYSFRKPIIAFHCPVLDPRTIDKSTGQSVAEPYPLMSDDELLRLSDHYVAAAKIARDAGFDFVDVKQCHRYLLSEILAAKTRPGRFGGSLANRASFALGIIERIRSEAPGLLIGTRLNAFDGIAFQKGPDDVGVPCSFTPPYLGGFGTDEQDPTREDLTETLAYVGMLQAAGVSLVNISMGCPYFNPHVVRPAEYPPIDGYQPPEDPLIAVGRHFRIAHAIQNRYPDLAILGSGYSYLQEYLFHAAAANVAAKSISFIGLGRASLAYPHSPNDILQKGTLDRKSVCRTFSYCTNLMRNKNHPLGQFPTGCPPFDKEVYNPIWKDAQQATEKRTGKD